MGKSNCNKLHTRVACQMRRVDNSYLDPMVFRLIKLRGEDSPVYPQR